MVHPDGTSVREQSRILAKTIYRELRGSGFSERDVMALAGELLSLVTTEVRGQSGPTEP